MWISRDVKQNTIQASDVLQYDHKREENKIATYTGCGNANITLFLLTKRVTCHKINRCLRDAYEIKKTRDDTTKVTKAKVTCFGSRPLIFPLARDIPRAGGYPKNHTVPM